MSPSGCPHCCPILPRHCVEAQRQVREGGSINYKAEAAGAHTALNSNTLPGLTQEQVFIWRWDRSFIAMPSASYQSR